MVPHKSPLHDDAIPCDEAPWKFVAAASAPIDDLGGGGGGGGRSGGLFGTISGTSWCGCRSTFLTSRTARRFGPHRQLVARMPKAGRYSYNLGRFESFTCQVGRLGGDLANNLIVNVEQDWQAHGVQSTGFTPPLVGHGPWPG